MFLLKNNKQEVDLVLSSDPVLKAEIEYDMKTYQRKNIKANNKNISDIGNNNDELIFL